MTHPVRRPALALLACVALSACASAGPAAAQVPPAGQAGVSGDTLDPNWVPAGYGTLRQDDIALKSSPANGLQIRAIPLDERFIRLLSPDSYRSLRELQASKAQALLAVKERNRLPSYSIWYVSFFALEQGETRFSPQEFIISNTGRDFRPLDIVPLTPGFGEYRLKQREVQSALLVFDGQIDLNQPVTAQLESVPSVTDWNTILQRVERERALVRSRVAPKR
ncbi:hypothetical protein [Gemmatimonas sp.]|uniref:hypothetical protein n=1 Tax=Gemmatimonas sp. TaxID=1962908 RepID=UPI0022BE06DE|nr:hypothetical protein [Gemmatimonas sp.]MCZ8203301.1 hypothetical protein [Gemmatimonas sp.]